MPKKPCLFSWVSNNGGTDVWNYDLGNKSISCRVCKFSCPSRSLWQVIRHSKTSHHINNLKVIKKHKIQGDEGELNATSFNLDIAKLLVSCNIPLNVVDHSNFCKFVEKYTGKTSPGRWVVTNLVGDVCQGVLDRIKEEVKEKDIFVALDETRDQGSSITAIFIGSLDENFCGRPYLIDFIEIANANNVKNIVCSSVYNLLGEDFAQYRLKVFITDNTSYCIEAGEDLRTNFPELIHITCDLHGLHRDADMVRQKFPLTNELISNVKKMFLNSARRKRVMNIINKKRKTNLSAKKLREILITKCNECFVNI
uniref:Putative LOC100902024 [Metaseiulus occidentalis] n=1 Tax=Lepeophtheirus salmonis TaxID=72036 RepID=A0A0K2ULW2_LEPSM